MQMWQTTGTGQALGLILVALVAYLYGSIPFAYLATYLTRRRTLTEEGSGNVGKWVTEEVNLLNDYRMAFAQAPPATASLALMSDSDNTGESAIAGIDFVEVYR